MSPRPAHHRRIRLIAAALATAGLLVGSSRASAETVSLYIDKTTGSAPVPVKYTIGGTTSTASVTPGPYYWHQVGTPLNSNFPANVTTFCVELNQGFPTPSSTYTVDALGAKVNAATATAITKLYGNHYDSAWNSTSFGGSAASTAFQIALWELVYDGPGSTLGSGNFRYNGSTTSASTLAASWLAGLASESTAAFTTKFGSQQLVWLSNGSKQDQLTLKDSPQGAVPAPPSIVLAGLALVSGLSGRALRRRKAADAAN